MGGFDTLETPTEAVSTLVPLTLVDTDDTKDVDDRDVVTPVSHSSTVEVPVSVVVLLTLNESAQVAPSRALLLEAVYDRTQPVI